MAGVWYDFGGHRATLVFGHSGIGPDRALGVDFRGSSDFGSEGRKREAEPGPVRAAYPEVGRSSIDGVKVGSVDY